MLRWDKAFQWISERKGRNWDIEKKTERMALADKIPVRLCGGKKFASVSSAAMVTQFPV